MRGEEESVRRKEKAKIEKQREKEAKKQTREKAKLEKEKAKKQTKLAQKEMKGGDKVEECICPECEIDYYDEETDAEWIGCDGECGQWWHLSCTELLEAPAGAYYCPKCS